MPREEPFFRKCCYCIPLKSCLQVWSCIKSIIDVSLAVFLTLMVLTLASFHELDESGFRLAHMFVVVIVILFLDSGFMVVLTIGLWTNNLRTLRIFLYYSIYMVFMGIACLFGFPIYILLDSDVRDDITLVVIFAVSGLINAGLDVCIFFTLKSEMIKLRNKQQYEFVQMPTLDQEEEETTERDLSEPFQADA